MLVGKRVSVTESPWDETKAKHIERGDAEEVWAKVPFKHIY